MNRLAKGISIGAAIGLAVGAATVRLLADRATSGIGFQKHEIVRDIRDVPRISMDETEAHRADRFASLTTLEDTLTLPSDFAQTEALYVLAGRANSAEVQNLIHQATRIADTSDRRAAMSILFSRLADIDPHSAVAIAGQAPFTEDQWVEASFWRNWSRLNLDAALAGAKKMSPASRKQRAAQAIYAAHGFGGNDITSHIERELGIAPDRWVKTQYLESLAADSPESAMAFALGLPGLNERLEALGSLGAYLGRTSPRAADRYSRLIENRQLREQFLNAANNAIAYANPALLIDRWLDDPGTRDYAGSISTAVIQLASTDLDAAIAYFDAAANPQLRTMLASGILQSMARSEPRKALEWARQNENGESENLMMQAIVTVAANDPTVALEAAAVYEPAAERDRLVAMVITSTVRADPELAVAALEQLPRGQQRNRTVQQVLSEWSRFDARAAMNWALDNRAEYGERMLQDLAAMYIQQYPREAMQRLPSLDASTAQAWSLQIAGVLADTESVSAATAFIDQYKGTASYPAMQSVLIPRIAQQDPALAKTMADQMPPGHERDGVIASLVGQKAASDPMGALAWVESIASEQQKRSAVSTVMMTWSHRDPAAAFRYVNSMRPGSTRDDVIAALVNSSREADPAMLPLIASIGDEQRKAEARLGYVYRLARFDISAAEAMLDDLNLSESEREQFEQVLQNYGRHAIYD
jgi:hypothetical protein